MKLGERILKLLDEKDMTQKQLAEELNIALSTLNGYIRNYREPDYNMIITIAQHLNTTVDYLIGFTDLPNYEFFGELYNDYNNLSPKSRKQLQEYMIFLKGKDK